jgi:putative FmdB family regulatory protein
MPTYDYRCTECGDFSTMRTIARRDLPCPCPVCGIEAQRALVAAPSLASMSSATRQAHAVNERSANAPRESSRSTHGGGCGCCASKVKLAGAPEAMKSSPTARPWMISH